MTTYRELGRKAIAYAVIGSLTLGQLVQTAQAASTDISDVPMAVKNLSPANVMFMLDNSGSMSNIVVDAPYAAPSGIACSAAQNVAPGGAASPNMPDEADTFSLYIVGGVQKIRHRDRSIDWSNTPNPTGTPTTIDWFGGGRATVSQPAHGYFTGDIIRVSGFIPTEYNGDFNITKATDDTYTYALAVNPGVVTTVGTVTKLNALCFDPNLRYNAKLNADTVCGSDRCPTSYLDAVYTGDFLNWYFYNGGATFGSTATRKPGTVTRLEVTKSASKSVLDTFLNNGTRVRIGLSAYNGEHGGSLREVIDNLSTNITSMKSKIDALTASGFTPLAETLSDIGRYFATGVPSTGVHLPFVQGGTSRSTVDSVFGTGSGRTTPEITNNSGQTIVAPVQNWCQRSFVLMMTDGQPQKDQNVSATLRNYKAECTTTETGQPTVRATGITTTKGSPVLTNVGASTISSVTIGMAAHSPPPSVATRRLQYGSVVVAKGTNTITLSMDAVSSATNQTVHFGGPPCAAGVPGGGGGSFPLDTDNFGMKVGRFYETFGSDYVDDVAKALFEMDLRPDLTPPSPTVKTKPNNIITYPIGFADMALIEDSGLMRDAAASGGGLYFSAANSNELVIAFERAADDILSKDGSAAAVAVANANVVSGDNASYASSYNSGTWTGDLIAYPIIVSGADEGKPNLNSPIWITGCSNPAELVDVADPSKGVKGCSAQAQLDLRDWTTRKIFTHSGASGTGQGLRFQPAGSTDTLTVAQQTLLNSTVTPPGPSDGAAVVNYLRGNRSAELTTYRLRTHVLGDIVNTEPLVVREPSFGYADTGYATFKSTNSTRTRIVIQGANDGILHAFNAATGVEEWAYVPNLVFGNLNNLSKKTGFQHRYTIDATPVLGDVDFVNTVGGSGTTDWRTITVGGLGKGGRGYYALDVTTTTAASEAAAAGKALWEFPNSSTPSFDRLNVGFSLGRPIIAKVGTQGWVVLVASGYNNGTNAGDSGGNGQGYLFVLNARTGAIIRAIPTGVGTATDPSGLAHIAGYVEATDTNNTVTHVYGGDTKGNLWRFDLTANNPASWDVTKIATLVDASGNFQPITTEPELSKIDIGGTFRRFVYVGTGMYLGDKDVPGVTGANVHSSQTQSMYGLIDDLSNTPTITPLRSSLQQQTLTTNADGTRNASSNTVDFSTKKGWYIDLSLTGERVSTNPGLALNALVFTSNIPNSTICVPGGKSFFNVLDYKTGGYLTGSTVTWSSKPLGDALSSRVVLIKLPSGVIKALARKSDATTESITVPLPPSTTNVKRRSWREVPL